MVPAVFSFCGLSILCVLRCYFCQNLEPFYNVSCHLFRFAAHFVTIFCILQLTVSLIKAPGAASPYSPLQRVPPGISMTSMRERGKSLKRLINQHTAIHRASMLVAKFSASCSLSPLFSYNKISEDINSNSSGITQCGQDTPPTPGLSLRHLGF